MKTLQRTQINPGGGGPVAMLGEFPEITYTREMETVTLKEHLEAIISLKENAAQKAMQLYREEIERRLQGLNELRREVTEDRGQFVKREVYDTDKESSGTARETLNKRVTVLETRIVTWTSAIGLLFLVINVILHYFK